MITAMQQYIRSANVEALEVEDEWVVLHADQYTVTKLNEVGGFCWSLLKEAQTSKTLAEQLLKAYDITEREAERDVEAFLAQLLELSLIGHAG